MATATASTEDQKDEFIYWLCELAERDREHYIALRALGWDLVAAHVNDGRTGTEHRAECLASMPPEEVADMDARDRPFLVRTNQEVPA